jgi:hypothetical protein
MEKRTKIILGVAAVGVFAIMLRNLRKNPPYFFFKDKEKPYQSPLKSV